MRSYFAIKSFQSTVVRFARVALARPATMAGSLRRCLLAGSRWPREGLMMPMESSTVTNCSPNSCRSISERPRHGKMSAISPVTRCDRFSLVETCAVNRQLCKARAVYSVSGAAARKLPPKPRKKRILPSAMFIGRSEKKLAAELFHERVAHVLANAHDAITLHIGMAAHRTRTRAGAPNVTTEQEKIHHLLNGRDGILVLGQTHRPAADDPFTAHRNLRPCANLITSQAAASEDVFPVGCAQMFDKRFKTDGLSLNKFAIEN